MIDAMMFRFISRFVTPRFALMAFQFYRAFAQCPRALRPFTPSAIFHISSELLHIGAFPAQLTTLVCFASRGFADLAFIREADDYA